MNPREVASAVIEYRWNHAVGGPEIRVTPEEGGAMRATMKPGEWSADHCATNAPTRSGRWYCVARPNGTLVQSSGAETRGEAWNNAMRFDAIIARRLRRFRLLPGYRDAFPIWRLKRLGYRCVAAKLTARGAR